MSTIKDGIKKYYDFKKSNNNNISKENDIIEYYINYASLYYELYFDQLITLIFDNSKRVTSFLLKKDCNYEINKTINFSYRKQHLYQFIKESREKDVVAILLNNYKSLQIEYHKDELLFAVFFIILKNTIDDEMKFIENFFTKQDEYRDNILKEIFLVIFINIKVIKT